MCTRLEVELASSKNIYRRALCRIAAISPPRRNSTQLSGFGGETASSISILRGTLPRLRLLKGTPFWGYWPMFQIFVWSLGGSLQQLGIRAKGWCRRVTIWVQKCQRFGAKFGAKGLDAVLQQGTKHGLCVMLPKFCSNIWCNLARHRLQ